MAPKRARRGSRASRGDAESIAGSQFQGQEEETDQTIQQQNEQNGNSYNGTIQEDDPSHVKIMLATDNHVGYMERDPVRGSDSINTFREILQMAKDHDVSICIHALCISDTNPTFLPFRSTLSCLEVICFTRIDLRVPLCIK